MNLTAFSIRNPVTVIVGVLLLILFGFIGLSLIPVQLTPDMEKPTISVRTYWTGGSPMEIEREIVEAQEEKLKSVEGLYSMTSESRDGMGVVSLEFNLGTDIDSALLKVSNTLQQVPRYPDGATRPILVPAPESLTAMAFGVIRPLKGRIEPVGNDLDFFEDYIKPKIERVPGVAAVNIYGGREREMQVIVDPQKMAARSVTIPEVIRALAVNNKNTSAGEFDEGKRRYVVRTVGEYETPEDIERVIIKNVNGQPIYVRDLAEVNLDFKQTQFLVRSKTDETMVFNVARATGANVLATMAEVNKTFDELNKNLLAARGLEIVKTSDETSYIKSALRLVRSNLIFGSILAVTVLFLFLRSFTSTLIIATTIPISLIGTFFLMFVFGRNINVISLAGMAFSVGMVVDAAIVVLENIYRHVEEGANRMEAALKGTREVWGAILASTLTTIAVFAPVIYIKEEAGQLFRDIAIAISSAIFLSLIVSITVIPAFSSRILRVKKADNPGPSSPDELFVQKKKIWLADRLASAFNAFIWRVVYKISGHPLWQSLTIVVLTSLAIGLVALLAPKAEYLPEGNRETISALMIPPPGYNLGELEKLVGVISNDLAPYWSVKPGTPEAAALDAPPIEHMFLFARGQSMFMGVTPYPEDAARVKELYPVVNRAIRKLPGVTAIVRQPSLFARGLGAGRAIMVEITGPDLDYILMLARRMYGQLYGLLPGSQMRPIPALDLGNPEVQIIPDRDRLAEAGFNASDLGQIVDLFLDGLKVSDYRYAGGKIDLTLMGDSGHINRTQDLISLPLRTPSQQQTTLGSVAEVKTMSGPIQINHIERERAIRIQVIPPEDLPLQTAMEKIQGGIVEPLKKSGDLGEFYNIKLAGTADKLTQTRKVLSYNFILALIIIFLLMAALFASFIYPLVIMFSVPMAAAGGFLGLAAVNLLIAKQSLDVLTMLGFVILIGVVVNNAILIVHQGLNNIRYGGLPYREAVAESVRTRLRPIFMSMCTSVLGMSPLVIFPGAGSELYRGLGGVVIGGLLVSTIFTIFLVPALFTLVLRIQTALGRAPKPVVVDKGNA